LLGTVRSKQFDPCYSINLPKLEIKLKKCRVSIFFLWLSTFKL
jgi:hypothetical protein